MLKIRKIKKIIKKLNYYYYFIIVKYINNKYNS